MPKNKTATGIAKRQKKYSKAYKAARKSAKGLEARPDPNGGVYSKPHRADLQRVGRGYSSTGPYIEARKAMDKDTYKSGTAKNKPGEHRLANIASTAAHDAVRRKNIKTLSKPQKLPKGKEIKK